MTDYILLEKQVTELTAGVKNRISNLANAAALLYDTLTEINWAGFYILNGTTLELGPFMGKPACVLIPEGKGVCGAAVKRNETVCVPDVHEFPGHIACDSASNSEVVIPIRLNGEIYGVLDIDSPIKERFSDADVKGLEAFAGAVERALAQ